MTKHFFLHCELGGDLFAEAWGDIAYATSRQLYITTSRARRVGSLFHVREGNPHQLAEDVLIVGKGLSHQNQNNLHGRQHRGEQCAGFFGQVSNAWSNHWLGAKETPSALS